MKHWKFGLGAGLLVTAAIGLSGCGATTIDLQDYLTYEFTGVNGYGEIDYRIQSDSMVDNNLDAFGISGDSDAEILSSIDTYLDVEKLYGSWDKKENLSNGDSVVFTWDEDTVHTIEEKYHVKLKDDAIKATVEGLQDVETYDAFQGLKVSFDGYAPSGTVSLDNTECGISSLEYTAKPSDHLKNGDKITVTVTVPENCAKQYGKIPKAVSKQYTVSGLDGFVTSAAEIPDDIMNAMKKQAEDTLKSWFAQSAGENEKLDSMTYVGNYFLTEKDGAVKSFWSSNDGNAIYLVYKTNYVDNGKSVGGYWFCRFSDVKVLADGTYSVDTTSYRTTNTWDSTIGEDHKYPGYPDAISLFNHCVTENMESYNYEDNVGKGDVSAQS